MPTIQEYHNFKVSFASMILPDGKAVGIDNAVFLQDIAYWCDYNKSSGSNYHEGRYWTYSTMDAISERHPYWTKKQVRRIIERCKEIGFLLVGNYNKSSYDRTIWYSVSDEALRLLGYSERDNANSHMGTSEIQDGQIENPERENQISHLVTAIPNNKKNNIKDTKQIFNSFLERDFSESLVDTVKDWIIYKKERHQAYQAKGLEQFLEKVKNSVYKYGEGKVEEVIRLTMASNYDGIIWNKLDERQNKKQEDEKPYSYPTSLEELRANGYEGF